MKLVDIYTNITKYPDVNWDEVNQYLAELATTKYYPALKALIEAIVADLLTQADDIKQVHEGHMSLKAFGTRAYIARVASDKIQSSITSIDQAHDTLSKE